MVEYIYNRKCNQDCWQIGFGETNPITEIIQSELSLSSKIKCDGDIFKIYFDNALSDEQKNTLDNIINDYIADKPVIKESRIVDGSKISEQTIEEFDNSTTVEELKIVLKNILLII